MRAYLRYVDDVVVLDDDKSRLAAVREAVREHLAGDRLRLHPRKAHVSPVNCGLNLLGYLVFPHHRRLRNDNGHRFRRRLRALARLYGEGRIGWDDVNASVQSWIGHARHADTSGLRPENRNDNLGFRLARSARASFVCCPELTGSRTGQAWRAGVHEPVSRSRIGASAE